MSRGKGVDPIIPIVAGVVGAMALLAGGEPARFENRISTLKHFCDKKLANG